MPKLSGKDKARRRKETQPERDAAKRRMNAIGIATRRAVALAIEERKLLGIDVTQERFHEIMTDELRKDNLAERNRLRIGRLFGRKS